MRRLRHLAGQHRTASINRLLGGVLAFNAGAVNAGGFLVVSMYTSHMTGFVSLLADNLVLGNMTLVVGAVGVLLAFTLGACRAWGVESENRPQRGQFLPDLQTHSPAMGQKNGEKWTAAVDLQPTIPKSDRLLGAAATAILVNWARQHGLRSEYAGPLLLEAVLLLVFGLMGAALNHQTPFAVPLTVLLLAFTMGLQNALISKISSSQIRTTHMTGVVTDIGIELGKLFYWNRTASPPESRVRANRIKLRLFGTLLAAFVCGGIVGAAGFKYAGFIWVVPLALLLLALCLPPLHSDFLRLRKVKTLRQGY